MGLRRLSTNPTKAAAQAITAMIMNEYNNGIKNGTSMICVKRYVQTEYIPNGKTPPQ